MTETSSSLAAPWQLPAYRIRREVFKEKFPASALITCAGFARTDMMVEIQGIAVVDK